MYIDDNKFIIITEHKILHFHFDLLKDGDKNLKHETDYIIKQNGFLDEQRIKNKIDRLLSKYKHRDDIHEHRKQ